MNLRASPINTRRPLEAVTLVEVLMTVAISAMTVGGVVYGFIQSAQRTEWSACSLAAQNLAMQGLEQARACKWDPMGFPPVDELVATNFPARTNVLDIPSSGDRWVWATNFTSISVVSTNPSVKFIRVDCVWSFACGNSELRIHTNSVATLRAPDQ